MSTLTICAIPWIMTSIFNYLKYIPQEQRDSMNFMAFAGFVAISPLVSLYVYLHHFLGGDKS